MDLLKELHHKLNSPRVWTKGSFVGGANNERHCMVGWMRGDPVYADERYEAALVLARVIQEQYPGLVNASDPFGTIVKFNDHKDTKFADVQRVIEKAIVRQGEEI